MVETIFFLSNDISWVEWKKKLRARAIENKQMLDIRLWSQLVLASQSCRIYKYKCEHQFSCTAHFLDHLDWFKQTGRDMHCLSFAFYLHCLEMRSWNRSAKLCALCTHTKNRVQFKRRDKRTAPNPMVFYCEIILKIEIKYTISSTYTIQFVRTA